MEGLTIIITGVFILVGLCLYVKIWRMADNVRELRYRRDDLNYPNTTLLVAIARKEPEVEKMLYQQLFRELFEIDYLLRSKTFSPETITKYKKLYDIAGLVYPSELDFVNAKDFTDYFSRLDY